MSDRGRFSIWRDDPGLDSWYDAAVNHGFGFRTNDGNPMEEMIFFDIAESNQVNYPSDASNEWFYGAAIDDNTIMETSPRSPTLNTIGLTLPGPKFGRLTIDKPLPPVPDSPTRFASKGNVTPSFDHVFVNAGGADEVKHGKRSPDNVSFEVDNSVIEYEKPEDNGADQISDSPYPEHIIPETPEYSYGALFFHGIEDADFTTHAFLRTDIPITSKDKYHAIAAVNSTSDFLIDEADEAEKAAASASFYSRFAVEERPSPYYSSVVDQTSGVGDISDRTEAFPQQWQDDERHPRAYTLAEVGAMVEDHPMDTASIWVRSTRMPSSEKTVTRSYHDGGHSPTAIDLTGEAGEDRSEKESNSSRKKRKAHASFVTKSLFDTSSSDDEEVRYLHAKKARIISNSGKDVAVKSTRRPSTYSLTTAPSQGLHNICTESETASAIFAQTQPAPVGYPGQFHGVMTLEQAMRDYAESGMPPAERQTMTTGNCLHPNYLFTHLNFSSCPHEDELDYRMCSAMPGTQTARSIEYADELTDIAVDTPRTAAEEALRREVYRECSSARLEGVSVGQYRYYEGHLNIEEYKEAGMCICWDACECSKMCTRYGDILCPCSKYIDIHKH